MNRLKPSVVSTNPIISFFLKKKFKITPEGKLCVTKFPFINSFSQRKCLPHFPGTLCSSVKTCLFCVMLLSVSSSSSRYFVSWNVYENDRFSVNKNAGIYMASCFINIINCCNDKRNGRIGTCNT